MLRSAAIMTGAVAFLVGATACGVPTTSVSQTPALPSAVTAASSPAVESAPADAAPIDSAPASSPVASVPVVSTPAKPVGSPPEDVGDLEQFVQASATTWWATVVGNLSDQLFLVRTVDAGQHWQDVTPSFGELHANYGVSSYVLSADVAWVDADAEPTKSQLFRTLDGGQSWRQMGTVPDSCTLQFLDPLHGWCWLLGGAMGSMSVELYRTADGGVTWQLISRTTGDGTQETPDALPFGCDKSLTFTSPTVGWASSLCNGGQPYLETSADGGVRWRPLTPVSFPDHIDGVGLSLPAVDGADIAVAHLGEGLEDEISTSTDGGRSWHAHRLPAASSGQYWSVDLIDTTHWRATDGSVIMSTDDAGAHWGRWTPAISMHDQYGTLELVFISPEVGTASDPADRYPLWSTTDGGMTWTKVAIDAGPYVLN
jgi:photosystem II stability/assembly factor-like uncharacterized protein